MRNTVRVFVKNIETGKVTAYASQRSACVALGIHVRSQLRNGQVVSKKYRIGREAINKRVSKKQLSPLDLRNRFDEDTLRALNKRLNKLLKIA